MKKNILNPEPLFLPILSVNPSVKLRRLISTPNQPCYYENYPGYTPLSTILENDAISEIKTISWDLIFWTFHQSVMPIAQSTFCCGPVIEISKKGVFIRQRLVEPPDFYYVDHNITQVFPTSEGNFTKVLNLYVEDAKTRSQTRPPNMSGRQTR